MISRGLEVRQRPSLLRIKVDYTALQVHIKSSRDAAERSEASLKLVIGGSVSLCVEACRRSLRFRNSRQVAASTSRCSNAFIYCTFDARLYACTLRLKRSWQHNVAGLFSPVQPRDLTRRTRSTYDI